MKEVQEIKKGVEMNRKDVSSPKIDPRNEVLGALVEFLNSDQNLQKTFEEASLKDQDSTEESA